MTIAPELRALAEELAEERGWSALDDRLSIMERLADRNLLNRVPPDGWIDLVEQVESHIRWLLT